MTNASLSAIQSDLDLFSRAWATNDGAALGSHYTEDGSLLNPFGELAEGRGAVAGMYSAYFGTLLRGSTTTIRVRQSRPVGQDHALVDADQVVYSPDGGALLTLHLTSLLRHEQGRWRFVDARPFAPSTPGA